MTDRVCKNKRSTYFYFIKIFKRCHWITQNKLFFSALKQKCVFKQNIFILNEFKTDGFICLKKFCNFLKIVINFIFILCNLI